MSVARWCAGVIAFCLVTPAAAAALITPADIVGRVTDATGGMLPDATVTIESVAGRRPHGPVD